MKYRIKSIAIAIFLLIFADSVFGQQFLWSTDKSDSGKAKKYVPMDSISNEVLTFHSQYRYYFDLSGYSKERFIKEIGFGFDDWKWLNDITNLTVYALRSNTGRGSVVMILCVTKDNVNVVLFSSDVKANANPQTADGYEKDKFISWFKTLLY